MKTAGLAAAGLFAAVLALAPLFVSAAEEPVRLTLLFTNDVHGYLEPCG